MRKFIFILSVFVFLTQTALARTIYPVAMDASTGQVEIGSDSDVLMGDGSLLVNLPKNIKVYEGTTQRNNPIVIIKTATVSSGTAIFYLTDDGTSTGNALFPTAYIDGSINLFVSDATASYQMSYAFSNSNKTLTVTANKLTTANILTGILGQAQANGATIKLTIMGY